MLAITKSKQQLVKSLLDSGLNYRGADNGETALMKAAQNPQKSFLQSLLSTGVNLDTPDLNQMTALDHAALHGHLDNVKLLLKAGAQSSNALVKAARAGHLEVVRYLTESTLVKDNKSATAFI